MAPPHFHNKWTYNRLEQRTTFKNELLPYGNAWQIRLNTYHEQQNLLKQKKQFCRLINKNPLFKNKNCHLIFMICDLFALWYFWTENSVGQLYIYLTKTKQETSQDLLIHTNKIVSRHFFIILSLSLSLNMMCESIVFAWILKGP